PSAISRAVRDSRSRTPVRAPSRASPVSGGRTAPSHNPRMPLTGKRLAFIGGGAMAEAMIRGLFDKHLVPPSHVLVTGPRRERRAELAKRFGVKALASNAEAARAAHVVVVSVK